MDASAMTEALVGRNAENDLLDSLDGDVAAPHLLDVDVLSALRGLTLGGKLDVMKADGARAAYFALGVIRHDVQPLAERVWQLRHRFTSYDSCYLALAEALDVELYTCDVKLDSTAHTAAVRVFGRTR